ncbi:hypothetical protein AX16_003207 [Volvariella volvacea WC 439]|nr:hypothetical protein AX16_003207 [Volvariella volvacea WC 439]
MEVIDLTSVPSSPSPSQVPIAVEGQRDVPRIIRWERQEAIGEDAAPGEEDVIDFTTDALEVYSDPKAPAEKSKPSTSRSHSPAPDLPQSANSAELFFIDTTPTSIEPTHTYKSLVPVTPDDVTTSKLLLPPHVTVYGNAPVQIISLPAVDLNEEEEYIRYLDYDDDRKDFVRYFDDPVEVSKTQTARTNCPNRGKGNMHKYDDCNRCGSFLHQGSECPTLWRLYEYLTDEHREQLVTSRKAKKNLKFGEGGEGYIAEDEWCYNCGESGHWGDDCEESPHAHDIPKEPSAFGLSNISSGPFSGVIIQKDKSRSRHWEQFDGLPGGWGKGAPENVGKQARKKEKERLSKRARQEEDDQDDWFGGMRRQNDRRATATKSEAKRFDISLKGAAQRFQGAGPPRTLLDRISDANDDPRRYQHQDRKSSGDSRPQSGSWRRQGNWERDRRNEQRGDHSRGPRYKGGYRT